MKHVLNENENANEGNEKLKRKKTVRGNLQVTATRKRNAGYQRPRRSVRGVFHMKTRVNVSSEAVSEEVKHQ
jgi:hypothetical protein